MLDRYLALDYGSKRIGLAITDPLKIIAQPLITLANDNALIENLEKIIKEKEVTRIILGNPLKLDGTIGPAAENVQKFAEILKGKFSALEILLVDERMTTAEANRRMLETDASRKTRKENVDQTAAALLLQNYLKTLK